MSIRLLNKFRKLTKTFFPDQNEKKATYLQKLENEEKSKSPGKRKKKETEFLGERRLEKSATVTKQGFNNTINYNKNSNKDSSKIDRIKPSTKGISLIHIS